MTVMSSFKGTKATPPLAGVCGFLNAESSFKASAGLIPDAAVIDGAVHAVQPNAGSRKEDKRALSEPLTMS